jgi:hypothetical protein
MCEGTGVRRLGIALCVTGAVCLASAVLAGGAPLAASNVPVRFSLARGSHPSRSTRVLSLVYHVTFGGCETGPPPFAGYALAWTPHRLTVTLFLRPATPFPAGRICPLIERIQSVVERIKLPHALGRRTLYDGATNPPTVVRPSPSS